MSKSICRLILAIVFVQLFNFSSLAQERSLRTAEDGYSILGMNDHEYMKNPNNIKINLFSLALNNISLQYERNINKPFSFALGFRFMPGGALPFKKTAISLYDPTVDSTAIKNIESLRLNQFAITPELRWYVGKKGYGQGFYFAPFFRYTRFSSSEIGFDYVSEELTNEQVLLKGSLTTQTLGLMLGAQWDLGSNLSLDWWIIGPQIGSATGVFEGRTTRPLSQLDQADVLQNLQTAFGDFSSSNGMFSVSNTINVNSQGATVTLKGPWSGIRAGLCLGFRF
jgi:hypothetical protein